MGYTSVTSTSKQNKGQPPSLWGGREAYLMANANLLHGKSQENCFSFVSYVRGDLIFLGKHKR